MQKINKEFKLEAGENLRELGGYKTLHGKVTKEKVYLRGGRTSRLTDRDIEKLIDYGVNLELDLRSKFETENDPSRLKDRKEIEYINISMLDGMANMREANNVPASMYELYLDLLENSKEDYKKIFKLLLENDGVTLFHCSAGKDRTGVLTLLLLGLAGVDRETIVGDYAISEKYLKELFTSQAEDFKKSVGGEIPQQFLESKEIDMEKTIDYLEDKYDGVPGYLKSIGLSQQELDSLNKKFLK